MPVSNDIVGVSTPNTFCVLLNFPSPQDLFGVNAGNDGGGRGRGRRGQGRQDGRGGRGGRGIEAGVINTRGDAAAAAGNQPAVFIQNQLSQALQRRNVDTSDLRDMLYSQLNKRAQAAFQYIPVPPPPALPAPPALAPAPPAPAPAPVATASLPSRILELVNLRNAYANTPELAHLLPGITARISALNHSLINDAE